MSVSPDLDLVDRELESIGESFGDVETRFHASAVTPDGGLIDSCELGQMAFGDLKFLAARVDDVEPKYCVGCARFPRDDCAHATKPR